jgi:hypothetical protein
MEITDIAESDPKKMLVEIDKAIRPELEQGPQRTTAGRRAQILSYYEKLKHAAQSLGFEFAPKPPFGASTSLDDWEGFFEKIMEEIDKMKIDIVVENTNRQAGVALDQAWRDKIHSYVEHIRQIVNAAKDLSVQIKEKMLRRLQAFDAEVDRTRTRVQIFTDVFVSICEGVSEGAEALTPAVRLGERIIGALARLQGQPPVLSLPSPEQFALPPPDLVKAPSDPPPAA